MASRRAMAPPAKPRTPCGEWSVGGLNGYQSRRFAAMKLGPRRQRLEMNQGLATWGLRPG